MHDPLLVEPYIANSGKDTIDHTLLFLFFVCVVNVRIKTKTLPFFYSDVTG